MKKFIIPSAAIAILLASSCSPVYYATNSANITMFREKREVSLSGGSITGSEFKGFELQTAFAVAKNVAFMVNGFSVSGNEENNRGIWTGGTNIFTDASGKGSGNLIEFAPGYFRKLGHSDFVFETYGGWGAGNVENIRTYSSSRYNINRLFIQPSISYAVDNIEIGTALRVCRTHYNMVSAQFYDPGYGKPEIFDELSSHPDVVSLEPSVVFRFGLRNIKLHLALTIPKILSGQNNLNESFSFNGGATIHIFPGKKSAGK